MVLRVATLSIMMLAFSIANGFHKPSVCNVFSQKRQSQYTIRTVVQSESDSSSGEGNRLEKLLLRQEELKQQMAELRSKYPTSEAEYLAASKARAAQKVESVTNLASDEDWKAIANAKKQIAGGDGSASDDSDWEQSAVFTDAGSQADSQALLLLPPEDFRSVDDNEDEAEPKLLLF